MTDEPLAAENTNRLAGGITNALEAVWKKLGPDRHAEKLDLIAHVLEEHEQDFRALIPQVVTALVEHPDFPEEAKDVFRTLAEPEHFAQATVLLVGIYPIVSGFVQAAIAPYTNDVAQLAWAQHPKVVLSPAILADAVIKGVMDESAAAQIAASSGVSVENFHTMVMAYGQAIDIEQALLLYRRGDIDEAELERVVRYSNVRTDFLPDILKLKYVPPGAAEAIMGAVKGHLSDEDAKARVAVAGIDPADFDWLKATAGRPPGVMESLQLVNRGIIDEATFETIVQQSDVQDKWTPALLALRVYLPPVRSVVPMVRSGAISDDDARELLAQHGVPAKYIDAFILEAHLTKSTAHHELTVAQIKGEYTVGMIDADAAVAALGALGYDQQTATTIVRLADDAMILRAKNAAVNHVGSLFTKRHIDQQTASQQLDVLAVHATVRDRLITLWSIERAENVAQLTLAQCQGAWRRGVMSDEQFEAHVVALGHPSEDVPTLKALAFPPTQFNGRNAKDVFPTGPGQGNPFGT